MPWRIQKLCPQQVLLKSSHYLSILYLAISLPFSCKWVLIILRGQVSKWKIMVWRWLQVSWTLTLLRITKHIPLLRDAHRVERGLGKEAQNGSYLFNTMWPQPFWQCSLLCLPPSLCATKGWKTSYNKSMLPSFNQQICKDRNTYSFIAIVLCQKQKKLLPSIFWKGLRGYHSNTAAQEQTLL